MASASSPEGKMSRFRKMESLVDVMNNLSWSLNPQKYYDVINQIIELFIDGGQDEIVSEAAEDLKAWETTKLTIAVTGEAGAGKSSFINAFRGLRPKDKGAAPIGITQMTQKPGAYSHPNFPNVIFWDLPGIGTPEFPPKTYLEQVNFSRYDFFIIICSERFRSSNLRLAQKIQAMGKKFYLIRSKVDADLKNMEMTDPETYSEEQALKKMRDDCKQNLEKEKHSSPQVFLTSCWYPDKYDFLLLLETLENDLPSLKRLAFLLSLPNISPEVIRKKKDALKKQLWKIALVSAFVNAVPFEALNLTFKPCFDGVLLLKTLTSIQKKFGLDDGSLVQLARHVQKPVEELKAVIQSPPEKDIGTNLLVKLCASEAGPILSFICRLKDHFVSQVVGGVVSGVLSFVVTYWILSKFLDQAAEDAKRVSMKAWEEVEAGAVFAKKSL